MVTLTTGVVEQVALKRHRNIMVAFTTIAVLLHMGSVNL